MHLKVLLIIAVISLGVFGAKYQPATKKVFGKNFLAGIAYTKNGLYACAHNDGTLSILDKDFKEKSTRASKSVAENVAANDAFFAVGADDGVHVYDTTDLTKDAVFSKTGTEYSDNLISALDFSPDGKFLLIGHNEKVEVYTTSDWKLSKTLTNKDLDLVRDARFSPDNNRIGVAGVQLIDLWKHDGTEFKAEHTISQNGLDSVNRIAFSKDYVAASHNGTTFSVFKLDGYEKEISKNGQAQHYLSIAFLHNGQYFAVGSLENGVTLYFTNDWTQFQLLALNEKDPVYDVLESGDSLAFDTVAPNGNSTLYTFNGKFDNASQTIFLSLALLLTAFMAFVF